MYEYRFSLGRDASGKAVRISVYGRKKADCLKKYEDMIKTDFEPLSEKRRVGEWADRWLSTYKAGAVGSSTYNQYRVMIESYIKPSLLGGMLLEDVRPAHAQAAMKCMQGKSNSYATKMKATLWAIFETAIDNNLCKRNPCARIKVKAQSTKATSKKYFTVAEVEAVLAYHAARPSVITLGMVVLAYTGLRRGELLGLQWGDIDFAHDTLSIRRVVYLDKHSKAVKDAGKTESSTETIPMLPKLKTALQATKRVSAWIIPDSNGDFYNPKNFSTAFSETLSQVPGVRPLGTHAFRHSLGTHLLASGVDLRIIQQILRHRDIGVTGNVYVDVEREAMKTAMDKLPY